MQNTFAIHHRLFLKLFYFITRNLKITKGASFFRRLWVIYADRIGIFWKVEVVIFSVYFIRGLSLCYRFLFKLEFCLWYNKYKELLNQESQLPKSFPIMIGKIPIHKSNEIVWFTLRVRILFELLQWSIENIICQNFL